MCGAYENMWGMFFIGTNEYLETQHQQIDRKLFKLDIER